MSYSYCPSGNNNCGCYHDCRIVSDTTRDYEGTTITTTYYTSCGCTVTRCTTKNGGGKDYYI